MSGTYSEYRSLLGGELAIFVLASSKKGKWQVRFNNPLRKSPRYIRKSTGHVNEDLARVEAHRIYQEYQSRALLDLKTGHLSLDMMMVMYPVKMSKVMRSATKGFYKTYWKSYFADVDMSVISSAQILKYFEWKVSKRDRIRNGIGKGWRASTDSISADTLALERNCLAWLIRKAYGANQIARLPVFPDKFHTWDGVHQLPRNKRRGRFHEKHDYEDILIPEFKRINSGLKKTSWKPVLLNPDEPWDQDSNPWISRAKSDGIEKGWQKNSEAKDFVSKKSRYPTAVFYFASMLLAHSGIRVSEMVRLRHRDVSLRTDEDGKRYTLINIDQEVSKIGKHRVAICDDYHSMFRRYLMYRDEIHYHFNREIGEDDFLFPQPNGDKAYLIHRQKLFNLFSPRLKALGLHERMIPTKKGHLVRVVMSAYSFRSFYISQRLKNGLDIYTLSKNVGVSVKVLASTYDYNETWAFRQDMTRHIRGTVSFKPTKADINMFEEYEKGW